MIKIRSLYTYVFVSVLALSILALAILANPSKSESISLPEGSLNAIYVKFDGLDGESADKEHIRWSDTLSFEQGVRQPLTNTGASRRRGQAIVEDILLVKELDKASPKLQEAVVKGRVFPKVEIHLTASYSDAGRVTYYAYELKNVQVVGYNISGQGDTNSVPTEEVTLNFEEIKVTYTETDDAGGSKGDTVFEWSVSDGV